MLKPFSGSQKVKEGHISFTWLGAEERHPTYAYEAFEVRLAVTNPNTYGELLADSCTKREAWEFFKGYTKRHPGVGLHIFHAVHGSDYHDCYDEDHLVWSTNPVEVAEWNA